jgi:hypothetical protein
MDLLEQDLQVKVDHQVWEECHQVKVDNQEEVGLLQEWEECLQVVEVQEVVLLHKDIQVDYHKVKEVLHQVFKVVHQVALQEATDHLQATCLAITQIL